MSKTAIGVDVGGTWARVGVHDEDHKEVGIESRQSTKNWSLESSVCWIAEAYHRLASDAGTPIGIALPGVIDYGIVTRSINLPWLEGHSFPDLLQTKIGRRPVVMTDAEAATWGEYVASGCGADPFAHLRLGTGVACGIVVAGELVPTDPTRRTHWPLLIVDESPGAPVCPCGLRGCLELFAGGDALGKKAKEIGSGRAAATAQAIRNLVTQFGVKFVALGGGVLEEVPILMEQTKDAVAELHLPVEVRKGRLGDLAGVIGAAILARRASLHSP